MSSHCYVGVTEPHRPRLAHARFVLCGGHPSAVLPTLAAIWARHAHYNTRALVTAILASDWEYLDQDITAAAHSAFTGKHPVPGVGMALASICAGGTVDAPESVTVFPLSHARHLDVEWIYLLDPDSATVAMHADDGSLVARYPLSGCLPRPAAANRCMAELGGTAAAGAPR
ncbi:hypothetical protein ACFFMM_11545 [Micromonospora chaiyaphumensis]|uniref:Uncharacterized protein n=1 Tax=Micromonospora chaiyaphumensis TaxID=307119 RepID=A0A1C4W901_9ACTN|nr:hypothetical protein [Micromonospora chaiyaphumensis]SCE92680.1 hypothetical protein GA0070214_103346 [Micromonospora chaiyaphumensis]